MTLEQRPTILAVDDTPINLTMLNEILKPHYRVKVANNGSKALEIAASTLPDLILLDVMMPGIDGYEVCRRLKANPATHHIPVIFLTSKTEVEDEETAFAAGAADFIHKPISPPIVLLRVKNHLEIKFLHDYLQSQSEQERSQKIQLMQIFSKHVSHEIAETMWQQRDQFLNDRRPPPQQVTATVMFTDIRGFTTISEQLAPHTLFDWLNQYMNVMSKIVIEYHGVVNKYIGDAIMAVFGMPSSRTNNDHVAEDALRAVDCALAMRDAIGQLNLDFVKRGLPPVGIRIGIFTGEVAAGTLGSSERLEYTVIGDTVNTAARLEEVRDVAENNTLDQDCRILIGETTLRYLDTHYHTQFVRHIVLKGKKEPVAVFNLVSYHA
ncbi:MAG: adenylate/guanylate cyclase domain-containing protein [Gallionella sp.]